MRPFLTMQSGEPPDGWLPSHANVADFCPNSQESLPMRHYLIGITNPFFLKRIQCQGTETNQAHVVYLAGPETR